MLIDGFDSFCRKSESYGLLEFRYVNSLLLEIWVFSLHASRVELGSTSPVGVSASYL